MIPAIRAYLDGCRPDHRAALLVLHDQLSSLLPDHVECISYAMPGFRQPGPKGKIVVGYAAFRRHLGLYPHSGTVIPQILADCAGFKTSKAAC